MAKVKKKKKRHPHTENQNVLSLLNNENGREKKNVKCSANS